ncbi:MAG: methylated-DNA--[protein]-cysteine S-methyltransferase [Nitrososphaerota archaeon]|nr:methylated-DNA--[protein]-cysteine S-methyltransferase [Nitrososphaerota archaeon]
MIPVHVENVEGIFFAVVLRDGKILRTTFNVSQKATMDTIRGNLVDGNPVEMFTQPSRQLSTLFAALRDLYDGKNTNYNFILSDASLPPYSQRVLRAVSAIPTGYVASYGAVAKAVGGGARAVGNVMASNPFPLIVPCHRIVKSDLGLGGYGAGGLGVKLEFLKREQRNYSEPKEIEIGNKMLKVFPTETVVKKYC